MRLSNTVQWRRGWTGLLALLAISVWCGTTAAQAQNKAYVTSTAANVVTVIDTVTGAVLRSIPVGTGPTRVAITPDGARAYVSNRDSGSISVIETTTDSVVATIAVGTNPVALAATPDGRQVYVLLAGGIVQVLDGIAGIVATIQVPGSGGDIALSPDGTRAYVASGPVSVIDTSTRTVESFFLAEAGNVTAVAVSPDGARAYFAANGNDIFGSGGALVEVDTSTRAVTAKVGLGSLPGPIALTPDGGRAYVGIQAAWVNTGYGSGFMPGRSVAVIDTTTRTAVRSIDLGSVAATATGIAVTPDRGNVYVSIPRLGSVAVIDASTNAVTQLTPVAAGPNGLAVIPDAAASLKPYVIDAVDDRAASALPAPAAATAVVNVLSNDRLGGVPATLANVTLSQVSSTDPRIALDAASGAVRMAAGAAAGEQRLDYQICERARPLNCDTASVRVSVRNRYVIDAVDDSATSPAGRTGVARVLANDTLNGVPATLLNVKLTSVSSTHAGVALNATGSVSVALGTPVGTYSLAYRICELADPLNCDQATVTVNVIPNPIDAVNDAGVSTRSGGVAIANVLANDRFAGGAATLTQVTLAAVSSSVAGIALNPANGSVTVAAGTAIGIYSLVYRICERASPSNCDQATVTVTVKPYVINAVNDSARGSSTTPGTVLASVLGNDFLGNVRATSANVTLTLVSLTPASNMIKLDLADGSVDVLAGVAPGFYVLVYQICEIANPTNCDRATVALSLSSF